MLIWKSKQLSHEGIPLLLRYLEGIDTESCKALLPELAVITHEFSKVSPNGLPEPDYNDSLLQFDSDIRAVFENREVGQAVLIETFAGKRRYYIYVSPKINLDDLLSPVSARHPHENLTWSLRLDPEWEFIKQYAKDFLGQ